MKGAAKVCAASRVTYWVGDRRFQSTPDQIARALEVGAVVRCASRDDRDKLARACRKQRLPVSLRIRYDSQSVAQYLLTRTG